MGENVNVKTKRSEENEDNLMSTIFFYLNLSKILHFLFFKTKRERKKFNDKEDMVEFQY